MNELKTSIIFLRFLKRAQTILNFFFVFQFSMRNFHVFRSFPGHRNFLGHYFESFAKKIKIYVPLFSCKLNMCMKSVVRKDVYEWLSGKKKYRNFVKGDRLILGAYSSPILQNVYLPLTDTVNSLSSVHSQTFFLTYFQTSKY